MEANENKNQQGVNTTDVSISACSQNCPECNGEGCGFCNNTGIIWYLPSPDTYDYIQIARAKWRLSQRH